MSSTHRGLAAVPPCPNITPHPTVRHLDARTAHLIDPHPSRPVHRFPLVDGILPAQVTALCGEVREAVTLELTGDVGKKCARCFPNPDPPTEKLAS